MERPVKTLGILGGGQLGRMSAMAAARLGIDVHIYCPEEGCPASKVSAAFTRAEYEDKNALKEFAEKVDVISYEFENIPIETIRFLKEMKPVYPDDNLLEISQDRLREKDFLNSVGIETARYAPANRPEDIPEAMHKWDVSNCIIKTTRFGYDGKGQVFHRLGDDTLKSWAKLGTQKAIIEEVIDFSYEISVIVARDMLGQSACYPAVLNEHKNHILWKTTAPAPIPKHVATKASDITHHLAEAVGLVGVMALELFVTENERIVANEIAPRTHNSGHWTIDACPVSQFEQHVRTVCGMPVGIPSLHSKAVMMNLLGDDVNDVSKYLEMENACLHIYGKTDAKEKRKMGHVTLIDPR